MKKLIISFVAIILSVTIVMAATPKKKEKPSDYAIGIKYEQALKSEKPSVLLFYSNWCTYCKRFMPMFETLSKEYQNKYNFVMVNAEKNENLAIDYMVSGYPTLYIIDPSIDNRIFLNDGIYGSSYLLHKELDRYLNVRARIK